MIATMEFSVNHGADDVYRQMWRASRELIDQAVSALDVVEPGKGRRNRRSEY